MQTNKRMEAEDALSKHVRLQEENAAYKSRPSGPVRPEPQFRAGQAVHHYWASWMEGCAEAPEQVKKKSRASWYDAHISGPPEWKEIVYGGFRRETWAYAAY